MDLKEKIEVSKNELQMILASQKLGSSYVLKLSQELDKLIVEYQKLY